MDRLKKLKKKFKGKDSEDIKEDGVWELSDESNQPYEQLSEQTEAVNSLYGLDMEAAHVNPGLVTEDIDTNANDVPSTVKVTPNEALNAFGSSDPPRSAVTSQPARTKSACSFCRILLVIGIVIFLLVLLAIIIPLAVIKQKDREAQEVDRSKWFELRGNLTVTQWNYTHNTGDTMEDMSNAFQADLCHNIEMSLNGKIKEVYKDCVLNFFAWDFHKGQGQASYSIYFDRGGVTEKDMMRLIGSQMTFAVNAEKDPQSPSFQFLKADPNSLDFDEDVDDCLKNDCAQICDDLAFHRVCRCRDGFILKSDGKSCDDVDECRKGLNNCNQLCRNDPGSHHCECKKGYQLQSDNATCIDTNECLVSNGGCDHTCTNSNGSYSCSCSSRFDLNKDGHKCDDRNECMSLEHNCQQECVNTHGNYECGCYKGFTKINETNCVDVNECSTEVGQKCDHRCVNTAGSFQCLCAQGYRKLADGHSCTDIDECKENLHNCTNFCNNNEGSYECMPIDMSHVCHEILLNGDHFYQGLRQGVYDLQDPHYFTCDERETYKMRGANMFMYFKNSTSRWLVSSQMCSPLAGIRTVANTMFPTNATLGDWQVAFSRKWINSTITSRCLQELYDCNNGDHPCDHDCVNVDNIGYTCNCPQGFNLSMDAHSCKDIDECLNPDACQTPFCLNTEGSFNCMDIDSEDLCQRLLFVTGENYQSERAGTYMLDIEHTCGGRPVWKHAGRPNYLYYISQSMFWVVGETPCGSYVGVLVEGMGGGPWEIALGDWKHWNGSSWEPANDMAFKCVAEGCAENEFVCTNGDCIPEWFVCDNDVDCVEDGLDETNCPCEEQYLVCDNGQCIGGFYHTAAVDWCDGIADCFDESDEKPNCQCLEESQFTCGGNSTRQCISNDWKCDGDPDCADGSDEMGCVCGDDDLACPSTGICLPKYWFCDGENDCGDWGDEINCTCPASDFKCDMGLCISARRYCDGINTCPDGSDEPEDCTCLEGLHQCDTGECLLQSDLCDGFYDCDDITDEDNCGCPAHMETCTNNNCYYATWRCDGDNDCGDFSDEMGCPCDGTNFECDDGGCTMSSEAEAYCNGLTECLDESDEPENCADDCRSSQFSCDGRCLSTRFQCNGNFDCLDNSDEQNCPCDGASMLCSNGLCLSDTDLWCNGRNDCGDWSDETNCNCTEEQVKCDNGLCIFKSQWCNGSPHCPDDSDEKEDCTCLEEQHSCGPQQECITGDWVCDGFQDCVDGSDEYPHQSCECLSYQRSCDNGQCVHNTQWCDNRINCEDLSDETHCACDTDENMFQCDNGVCIYESWVCDNEDDCKDLSDERMCSCDEDGDGVEKFRCYSNAVCIPRKYVCDGIVDCPDAEDEALDCHECSESDFVCNNYMCVSETLQCDGVTDCSDHSDEFNCLKHTLEDIEDGDTISQWSLIQGYHNKTWLPICADDWNDEHSDVTCHQMGFGIASETFFANDRQPDGTSYLKLLPGNFPPFVRLHEMLNVNSQCDLGKVVTLRCEEKGCGQRKQMPEEEPGAPFIINGADAVDGSWPWVAAIYAEESGEFFCGGTLISKRWIATSAHCIEDETDLSLFRIRLGTIYRTRLDDNARTYRIQRVVNHPAYSTNDDFDVALMELSEDVVYTDTIQPLCLPEVMHNFTFHRQCYLAGWGSRFKLPGFWDYMPSFSAETLQQTRMLLLSPQRCAASEMILEDGEPYVLDTNITLCAGHIDGHSSACDGDSGSPLMCESEEGSWTMAGITMMSNEHCDTYTVFVRVEAVVSWIQHTMTTVMPGTTPTMTITTTPRTGPGPPTPPPPPPPTPPN